MKYFFKLLLVILFLLLPTYAFSVTIVFQTGFEGDMQTINGSAGEHDGLNYIFWADDPNPVCITNPTVCTEGYQDSETGYNMPNDLPGRWNISGTGAVPYFNMVIPCDGNIARVASNKFKNGSQSFEVFDDECSISGLGSRLQLNIDDASSGAAYHRLTTTAITYWVYFDTPGFVAGEWMLFEEWLGPANRHKLSWYISTGKMRWTYEIGGTSCDLNTDDCLKNTIVDVPYQKWFQVKSIQIIGDPGYIYLAIKPEGEAEQVIFNQSVKNNYDGTGGVWMPLKNYGAGGYFVYWDDFTIFSITGSSDIPPWADDIVISNPQPDTALVCDAGDPRNVTISIATNIDATCKYDLNDVDYGSMANTFSTTGGQSHSKVINLGCDASYAIYTRCTDGVYTNSVSTAINFSIDAPPLGDTTPPVISNPTPVTPPEQVCESNPRDVVISVVTTDASVPVTCRACLDGVSGCGSDTAYVDMLTNGGFTFDSNVYPDHSHTLNKNCGEAFTYQVRCIDDESNVNVSSTQLTFSIIPETPYAAGGASMSSMN